jgi:hypothetical protein
MGGAFRVSPLVGRGIGDTWQIGRFRIEGITPGLEVAACLEIRPVSLGGKVFERATLKLGEVRDFGDINIRPRSQ